MLFDSLGAIFIDVKIREAMSKAWNWAMRVVFSIRSRESSDNYYISAISCQLLVE